jgi:hypothetical protein
MLVDVASTGSGGVGWGSKPQQDCAFILGQAWTRCWPLSAAIWFWQVQAVRWVAASFCNRFMRPRCGCSLESCHNIPLVRHVDLCPEPHMLSLK